MHRLRKTLTALLGLTILGIGIYAVAGSSDKPKATQVALTETRAASPHLLTDIASARRGEYLLSAPPGNYAEQVAMFQPVAAFLSRATGKRFVYIHYDNWLSYSRDVTKGAFDIVFDSAASNSWRIERINHTPLVRLPDDLVFAVIARADDTKTGELRQLAGKTVCTPPPPDMAALTLLSQFDNPARQPIIVEQNRAKDIYNKLIEGKCTGGVIALNQLEKIDRSRIKILYRHRALPNNTFSAGPRLSPALKAAVREALLSSAGQAATAKLRAVYGNPKWIKANPEDYAGLGTLLKDSLYYQ